MTWLLVEDDPDIRTVVAVMMQIWGENAMALPDGNVAWKWLDTVDAGATSDLPDLALMDIRMPGHTGDQIAARIRQTERLKHIPIILMTAFTLTDGEVQAMKDKVGIDHLIKKPLPDMDDFRTTLYRIRDEKQKQIAAARVTAAVPSMEPPVILPPVTPPIEPPVIVPPVTPPLEPPVIVPPAAPPITEPPVIIPPVTEPPPTIPLTTPPPIEVPPVPPMMPAAPVPAPSTAPVSPISPIADTKPMPPVVPKTPSASSL